MNTFTVINFYKFIELDDLPSLKERIRARAIEDGLMGTVLLAPEGINAGLSGTSEGCASFAAWINADPRFSDVTVKTSVGVTTPFRKLSVKVKRWIIRFAEDSDPSVAETQAGRRLPPSEVRRILAERPDDVVIVDTRNDYEFAYGTFAGAKTLPIRRFTEFPAVFADTYKGQEDKTYLFFCTGGVRCEKVVPWAERQGFKNSFQLDGGILAYFDQFGGESYEGDCFVFDERWLLKPELEERVGRDEPGHFPKRRQEA